MAAAAAEHVSLLLSLAVLLALVHPSHSIACVSQKFSNNRVYSYCTDLPQLGAQLHYTYNAANSSLSIAFIASPAPGSAWAAWAINPTKTGMVGSQALMALRLSDGSVVAKTYDVSSYSQIVESKLTFDVWDLVAEASDDGTLTIFASVKVSQDATSLNQVWQIGGAVNGTRPSIHPMNKDNKVSTSTLKLPTSSSKVAAGTPTSEPPKSVAVPTLGPGGFGLISGFILLIGSVIMLS